MKKYFSLFAILIALMVMIGCNKQQPATQTAPKEEVKQVSAEDERLSKEMVEEAKKLHWDRKYDEALAKLDEAIKKNPNSIVAYVETAEVYKSQNNYPKALEAIETALQKDPKDAKLYDSKAVILVGQSKYSDAVEAYKKKIELGKEDVDTLNSIANCYKDLKNYDEAEKYLQKAVTAFPEEPRALENFAYYWFSRAFGESDKAKKADAYEKAAKYYDEAFAKTKDDFSKPGEKYKYAEALFFKWQDTQDDNDKKRAVDGFKEFLKIKPDHVWADLAKDHLKEMGVNVKK